jgi:hypothetical protein
MIENLKEDMKDRFVRQEEFKEYKQRLLDEKFPMYDNFNKETKKLLDDHEVRISIIESKL